MKQILLSLLKQLIFWLLFFAFTRTVFFLFNFQLLRVEGISFFEVMAGYYHALQLDFATACYFLLFPFFLLLVQSFYAPEWLNRIHKVYYFLAILLFSLLISVELGIYPEWKTKLPVKAFSYLSNPTEVYDTISTSLFFTLTVVFLLLTLAGYKAYRQWFYVNHANPARNVFFSIVFALTIPVLLVVGARGGVQQIPINQSASYYSNKGILNIAAVNSGFNLSINLIENYRNLGKNPYVSYDMEEARETVKNLFKTPTDSTVSILTTDRPNIVLLILESWSADLIESLGGEPGITPEFRKLEEKGILFTNLWATGPRSEQAMGSIFGGFPAHPISSITVQPDKFTGLPTITRRLIEQGYNTSFYFGGQLIYGNIKGFILYNGFKRVVEGADFGNDVIKGKLGAHDEFVLNRQLRDLKTESQPFFSALFTLSSHSPYDQPMEEVLKWGDNERQYINSAYYTDRSVGNFIKEAETQPWFDNTLFILVADHSHNSYRNWAFTTPNYHRIPMLFYGNVIRDEFRGTKVSRLSNQSDLAKTILCQLNINADAFHWSRDLFNPASPEFAWYSFEEGLGWVRPAGHFVYDARVGHYHENSIPPAMSDSIIREGRSYLQVLFEEYMQY
ncbi:MAG TPA: LTA synthase family protein [Lentimicrobium sp.]|nr:LTA synthase family protein [Lentimicrobium sp.]